MAERVTVRNSSEGHQLWFDNRFHLGDCCLPSSALEIAAQVNAAFDETEKDARMDGWVSGRAEGVEESADFLEVHGHDALAVQLRNRRPA